MKAADDEAEDEDTGDGKVVDLMKILKQSVGASRAKRPARRGQARAA
jgi:non-homologous end joining protein Ku